MSEWDEGGREEDTPDTHSVAVRKAHTYVLDVFDAVIGLRDVHEQENLKVMVGFLPNLLSMFCCGVWPSRKDCTTKRGQKKGVCMR